MNGYSMATYNSTPKGWDYTDILVGVVKVPIAPRMVNNLAGESIYLRPQYGGSVKKRAASHCV